MNLETAVKALREMEGRATKGPWQIGEDAANPEMVTAPRNDDGSFNYVTGGYGAKTDEDNILCATTRNLLLPLLTLVEEGQKLRGLVSEHGAYDAAASAFLAAMGLADRPASK